MAPFNSSLKNEKFAFIEELKIENEVFKFVGKVREANRQYELNNNGEIDNGILINNILPSKKLDESDNPDLILKKEKLKLKIMSNPVSPSPELNFDKVSGLSSPHDQNRNKKNNSNAESGILLGKVYKLIKFIDLDEKIVSKIEEFGYKREHLIKSLNNNELNYLVTTYYLMQKESNSIYDEIQN